MTPIEQLSNDDFMTLATMISVPEIKMLFKEHPNAFHKYAPGREASKLKPDAAIKLFVQGRTQSFISVFVNSVVNSWLTLIEDGKGKCSEASEEDALASALKESPFRDHIDLYFKIAEAERDEDYVLMIGKKVAEALASPESETEFTPAANVPVQDAEEHSGEIKAIQAELDELRKNLHSTEETVKETGVELHRLQDELDSAYDTIDTLRSELSSKEAELSDLKQHTTYENTEPSYIPNKEYDHTSLCVVSSSDTTGTITLTRLADVSLNGSISPFTASIGRTRSFDDTNRIFTRNGPTTPGFYGVWDWSAKESFSSPDRPYYSCSYNPSASPVQAIVLQGISSMADLIAALGAGIGNAAFSARIYFAFFRSKGVLSGVLCRENDLTTSDNLTRLSENVFSLPQYDYESSDLVWLENRVAFLRKLEMKLPTGEIRIKEPLSIVKEIVLERVTWPIFKANGVTKNDWKSFKKYLELIPTEGILEKIASECRCSEEQANILLEQFRNSADAIFDGNTVEDSMIATAIMVNPELLQKSKELVREEWHSENEAAIKEAEARLCVIQDKIDSATKGKAEIDEEWESAKAALAKVSAELDEKLTFAANVEAIVEERIQNARKNAAEFIASMAFTSTVPAEEPVPVQVSIDKGSSDGAAYHSGSCLDPDGIEEYQDTKTAIEIIEAELAEAGVASKFLRPLAAYLYASYADHSCVFLAGPNATDIADAFSTALFGKTAGRLSFTGGFSQRVVEECWNSDDEIVVITEPFSPEWISKLPAIIKNDKFYVAVHPFVEDVLIEPKSIYNSFLPIFTEFLVDNEPTDSFCGGRPTARYEAYIPQKQEILFQKTLESLHAGMYLSNRIQRILTNLKALLIENNSDSAFLLALLPYAYATMQIGTLADLVHNREEIQLSSEMRRYARYLFNEFE